MFTKLYWKSLEFIPAFMWLSHFKQRFKIDAYFFLRILF